MFLNLQRDTGVHSASHTRSWVHIEQIEHYKCEITFVISEIYCFVSLMCFLQVCIWKTLWWWASYICIVFLLANIKNDILPQVLFGGLTAHAVLFEQARNVSIVGFCVLFFRFFEHKTASSKLAASDILFPGMTPPSRWRHTRCCDNGREGSCSVACVLSTTRQDKSQSKSHSLTHWLS